MLWLHKSIAGLRVNTAAFLLKKEAKHVPLQHKFSQMTSLVLHFIAASINNLIL